MEKLIGLFLVAIALVSSGIASADCYVGDVIVRGDDNANEETVLRNNTCIDGNVIILDTEENNFTFTNITEISGNLIVAENQILQTLKFPNLTSVGISLQIYGNPLLSTIGFGSLKEDSDGPAAMWGIIEDNPVLNYCTAARLLDLIGLEWDGYTDGNLSKECPGGMYN
jgi:hypothetical protein